MGVCKTAGKNAGLLQRICMKYNEAMKLTYFYYYYCDFNISKMHI